MSKAMTLRMPSYYRDFKCRADRCSDNCCIGWEIDIDRKAMAYYRSLDGEFGKRLSAGISESGTAHFILDGEGRCPFLNKNNLCDMVLHLGEEALCRICTEHPRYYSWYDGVKEGGVGLCCEAAAELIISQCEPFSYYETSVPFEDCGEYDKNFYTYLCKIRENILRHIQDKRIPLKNRLNDILLYARELQEKYDNFDFDIPVPEDRKISPEPAETADILKQFTLLEALDTSSLFEKAYELSGSWGRNMKIPAEMYNGLENAAVYFIWRHFLSSVYEDEFYSKIAFAVLSTAVMGLLQMCCFTDENCTAEEGLAKAAVYYSKEIEYSDVNLNAVFDLFYENEAFKAEKISSLMNIFEDFC
ncbi:MAG: flagellin lysine-N-methylase [Porcipelethomonas sp.]